jgi:hypothetical protein
MPLVGEAEHVLEVAASFHLVDGHDPVAEVRRVHVRTQEAAHRMFGWQLVVRDDREWATDHQVHPIEVSDERHVRRDGAHRQLGRCDPRRVVGGDHPQFGFDANGVDAASLLVDLEGDSRCRRDQFVVHLVTGELVEIPHERAGVVPGEVARVRARHCHATEVDAAGVDGRVVPGRPDRSAIELLVAPRVRRGEGHLRVGIDRREARVHRRDHAVEMELQLLDDEHFAVELVAGSTVRDDEACDRRLRIEVRERDLLHRWEPLRHLDLERLRPLEDEALVAIPERAAHPPRPSVHRRPTRFHGLNALSRPRSAGARLG